MSNNLKFYIGGAWVDPVTPNRIGVVDPRHRGGFHRNFRR